MGDKWRNEWRERVHDKRCVAVGEVGWMGVGGYGNIIGSRYGKANNYTLQGGIEFHRECVGLLVDILGMNHKIMLHPPGEMGVGKWRGFGWGCVIQCGLEFLGS